MELDGILGSDYLDLDINKLEKKIKKTKRTKKLTDNESLNKLNEINQESGKELENRLLKESIALSHTELKKFQNQQEKQIDNIRNTVTNLNNKINQLQDSNKTLTESIEHEINNLSNNIDILLISKVKTLNELNNEHINKLQELINKSQNRYETFYNKKEWIDKLIFINLAITPILFLIIFIKIFK
jgi:chromosome segregation ATPase